MKSDDDARDDTPSSRALRAPQQTSGTPSGSASRVVAVVVAYNRQDLLIQCLDALAAQSRAVDEIVVIDNASDDNSAQVACAHTAAPAVITLSQNIGGAGGFAAGITQALEASKADAVWLMDDDTIPTASALHELLRACDAYPGRVDVAASRAVWTDGRDHPMNTPRVRPGASRQQRRAAKAAGASPIRSTSFVSMLIAADAIRAHGLPIADYFIWNDDFEYSTRLLRRGNGIHVRTSVVEHRTRVFGATDADPGDRFFYEVRNKLWMFTRSASLSPREKVLYGGSSLRRWARTFAHSRDRSRLARAAGRGLAAGIRQPRATSTILADAGMTTIMPPPPRVRLGLGSRTDRVAAHRADTADSRLPFSVLLPVYAGDDAAFLRRAFDSATVEQTRPPAEVVIIRDGPVGAQLEAELDAIAARSPVPVTMVALPSNGGLANALTVGLRRCSQEVIARVDADDVSVPGRFAVQLPVIEAGADLVGSAIVEFATDEDVLGTVRSMPVDAEQIARRARFADPFNHPSVVYRRSTVNAVGGYEDLHLMEDYLLFARMIAADTAVANVPEVLVKYRVGAGSYARRGGVDLLRAEIELQRTLRSESFTSRLQFLRNVAVRGGYRLVPEAARRLAYRSLIVGRRARPHRTEGQP